LGQICFDAIITYFPPPHHCAPAMRRAGSCGGLPQMLDARLTPAARAAPSSSTLLRLCTVHHTPYQRGVLPHADLNILLNRRKHDI